jgi:4'-phosphopantetheinyl transferase
VHQMGGTMQRATLSAASPAHPGGRALGHGALHAWLVDLDAPGAVTAAGLDAAERARATTFVRPRDGARFAASRAALRLVLARYVGAEPADLEFTIGPHGQPRLAAGDVHFSLSRSGGLALVAVSRGPVGADLERVAARPGLADVAAARFAAREAACIEAGCGGSATRSFYRHWTAKEAYLKALGLGLAGLRDTELVCGARPAIWFAGRPVCGWRLSVTNVASRYVASVIGGPSLPSWRWLSSAWPLRPVRPEGSHR